MGKVAASSRAVLSLIADRLFLAVREIARECRHRSPAFAGDRNDAEALLPPVTQPAVPAAWRCSH
jgi:hypothetical protein